MKELDNLKLKLEQANDLVQDLQKKIIELESKQSNNSRWRAEKNNTYYWLFGDGTISSEEEWKTYTNDKHYAIGNYFETKEQAEKTIEKQKIYVKLKDLALRLNNGEKIDWESKQQRKYTIIYNNGLHTFSRDCAYACQYINQIYCLDSNFLDAALEEIGKDNLIKLCEED